MRRKSTYTERIYVAGGELDREGKTVQLAAQIDHDRHIAVAQFVAVEPCRGALDEKFDRRKTKSLGGRERGGRGRNLQWRQAVPAFALNAQWLAAGRQDAPRPCAAQHTPTHASPPPPHLSPIS